MIYSSTLRIKPTLKTLSTTQPPTSNNCDWLQVDAKPPILKQMLSGWSTEPMPDDAQDVVEVKETMKTKQAWCDAVHNSKGFSIEAARRENLPLPLTTDMMQTLTENVEIYNRLCIKSDKL